MLIFAENWRSVAQIEYAVVPFDIHLSMGTDVPDVPESSWIVVHIVLPDAHAH